MARTAVFVKIEEGSVPPCAKVTARGETTHLHPEIVNLDRLRAAVEEWVRELARVAVEDGKRIEINKRCGVRLQWSLWHIVIEDNKEKEVIL